MEEHVGKLKKALRKDTKQRFREKTREGAERLKQSIKDNELDNQDFTIGMELETYVINQEGDIATLKNSFFKQTPAKPELGLQNIEINAEPQKLSPKGVKKQKQELKEKKSKIQQKLQENNRKLLLDSTWTQHPQPEEYLTKHSEKEGFVFPENMRSVTRYHGIDNAVLERLNGEIKFSTAEVSYKFPSILFECLATSMQPHLQIPDTEQFPSYYNYAIRTMAPLLALTSNSPFMPPELYENPSEETVENSYHELRIPLFEQAVNTSEEYSRKKCRVPDDLENLEDAVDGIQKDETYHPWLREWSDPKNGFKDSFWELEYKRGTFWRWVRPVFGGEEVEDACGEKSVRIEYRPIPTQPTLKDNISVQLLVNGLLIGLKQKQHPLKQQSWEKAKQSFYNVVKNGLNAEIHWVNRDGEKTTEKEEIYTEIFELAEKGLKTQGFTEKQIQRRLQPLKKRWKQRKTPSAWKKQRVKDEIGKGKSFTDAVKQMQQDYYRLSQNAESFIES